MLTALKAAWTRLAGGTATRSSEPAITTVEYKGYRILAAPIPEKGQYRTAGTIEKDTPEGVRAHRFVRADVAPSRESAMEFTIAKAKQIIDQLGDSMFG
jgi:hypothetical protein